MILLRKVLVFTPSILQSAASFALPSTSFLLSRSAFWKKYSSRVITTTSSSLIVGSIMRTGAAGATATPPSMNDAISTSIWLLESVYGPVDDPQKYPLPMPADEAGLCADGKQRRYLWTDAFGVLAYISLAERFAQSGDDAAAEKYRHAAEKLVDVVHNCLGRPRSNQGVDAMGRDDTVSPTGFVGLRIGKVESKKVTDYGMLYDGQYWHYIDKWLFALARVGRIEDGIRIAKSVFPYFFDPEGGGIRWKISVDGSPPPALQKAHVGDDTLVALIVFSVLESARISNHSSDDNESSSSCANLPSLADEIMLLKKSLRFYKPRVTDDPLGWGLEAMYDQFLKGRPRERSLASLHQRALHPSHLSLPFRLYGAMIGARIAGESVAPANMVDDLVELSIHHQANAMARGDEEHSSINRVMLAMCLLCPGALKRLESDPLLVP